MTNNNIPVSYTTSSHCCEIEDDNDNKRYSCCSHCRNNNNDTQPINLLELQSLSLTPPLDNVYFQTNFDPFTCMYLLNLFIAPDIARYLKETSISDDVYDLPLHIQKLISEARMEMFIIPPNENNNNNGLKRLERVRSYVHSVTHGDTSAIISTLTELIHDEDELTNILGE